MKNKSLILGLVSAVFACNLVFTSCSEPMEVEKVTLLEKRAFTAEDSLIDQYSRIRGDGHSGSYFSRTDSTNLYGIGTIYSINDTNINSDLRVCVDLWARTNIIDPGFIYAVSLQEGDKVISWQQLDVLKQLPTPNKWTNVKDSITFSGSLINKPGLIIKAFAYNPNNASKTLVFDGDDLEISFKKVEKVLEE